MKYLIMQNLLGDHAPVIRLFLAPETHRQIAREIEATGGRWQILAAGFYDPATKRTFGGSDSLGVKARAQDGPMIAIFSGSTLAHCAFRDGPDPA